MPQCKVWLENYNGQYFPGNVIQGKVVLDFDSETSLRGIKVRVVCHEHTEFMDTESYYDSGANEQKSRDTLFKGDNEAFSSELMLYGSKHDTTSLPMGQHIYPFTFPLPPNVPSTYQGEHGSVTWKIIATVDRPMAFDYEDKFIFVMNAPVDLNALKIPELLEPTSYSDEKYINCLCCAQGPISMDIELPKQTLIPGETVVVNVRLSNMSNTNVEGVSLKLTQTITCKVTEPSSSEKYQENVLVDLNDVGLGAHGEHTYYFNVCLPGNVFIPNFAQCRLFKAEYLYKVTGKLPGVHKNLQMFMHPKVGHIPMGQGGPPMVSGAYPVLPPAEGGWSPSAPSAPTNGYNPKAQESLGNQSYLPTQPEQPPPSYSSLNV